MIGLQRNMLLRNSKSSTFPRLQQSLKENNQGKYIYFLGESRKHAALGTPSSSAALVSPGQVSLFFLGTLLGKQQL